jgi:hypothetical protein
MDTTASEGDGLAVGQPSDDVLQDPLQWIS